MKRPSIAMIGNIVCLLALSAAFCFAAPTSENNARLRAALERFPAADADGDGVLTMAEAQAYRQKARGGGRGRQSAQDLGEPAADKGPAYSGLYMGHSFFRPSAQELDEIVKGAKIVGHKQLHVFAGGVNGSPLKMWTNPGTQARVKKILDSGDIELLVMTYYGEDTSLVEHYSRWFDYAISKRPDVTFMVTIPWSKQPHRLNQAQLDEMKERTTRGVMKGLIAPLRKKYPKNKVLFCPYGLGVYELVERCNERKLPGVKFVLNPAGRGRSKSEQKKEQLVNDEPGHGGELISRLGALLWLQTLYDYDVSKLKVKVEGLPKIDINKIAAEVHKKIAPFNALYGEKKAQ